MCLAKFCSSFYIQLFIIILKFLSSYCWVLEYSLLGGILLVTLKCIEYDILFPHVIFYVKFLTFFQIEVVYPCQIHSPRRLASMDAFRQDFLMCWMALCCQPANTLKVHLSSTIQHSIRPLALLNPLLPVMTLHALSCLWPNPILCLLASLPFSFTSQTWYFSHLYHITQPSHHFLQPQIWWLSVQSQIPTTFELFMPAN